MCKPFAEKILTPLSTVQKPNMTLGLAGHRLKRLMGHGGKMKATPPLFVALTTVWAVQGQRFFVKMSVALSWLKRLKCIFVFFNTHHICVCVLFASVTHIWDTCLTTDQSQRASDSASTASLWRLNPEETTNPRLLKTTDESLETLGSPSGVINALILLHLWRSTKLLGKVLAWSLEWLPCGFLKWKQYWLPCKLETHLRGFCRTTQTTDAHFPQSSC